MLPAVYAKSDLAVELDSTNGVYTEFNRSEHFKSSSWGN